MCTACFRPEKYSKPRPEILLSLVIESPQQWLRSLARPQPGGDSALSQGVSVISSYTCSRSIDDTSGIRGQGMDTLFPQNSDCIRLARAEC